MKEYFLNALNRSIQTKKNCIKIGFDNLSNMGEEISRSILDGGKLLLCGNGGSAADAQHLAAELLVRLRSSHNRPPIAAIALAMDTSTITACGNDYSFNEIFERNVIALGKENDCLLAISSSGNSENIVLAMKAAKRRGMKVFAFLGKDGGKCKNFCDEAFIVPSDNTASIQEVHITIGHALMELIEDRVIENS